MRIETITHRHEIYNAFDEEKALNSKNALLEIFYSVTLLNWFNRLTLRVLRNYILGQVNRVAIEVQNPGERITLNYIFLTCNNSFTDDTTFRYTLGKAFRE